MSMSLFGFRRHIGRPHYFPLFQAGQSHLLQDSNSNYTSLDLWHVPLSQGAAFCHFCSRVQDLAAGLNSCWPHVTCGK